MNPKDFRVALSLQRLHCLGAVCGCHGCERASKEAAAAAQGVCLSIVAVK